MLQNSSPKFCLRGSKIAKSEKPLLFWFVMLLPRLQITKSASFTCQPLQGAVLVSRSGTALLCQVEGVLP